MTDLGVTSVQFLLASALGLLVFVALANLVVVQYGRGAIQSALDQGARIGAITGSEAICEAKVAEVLDQLLAGRMGDRVETHCALAPGTMSAIGKATFSAWTPITSDFEVGLAARATAEVPP